MRAPSNEPDDGHDTSGKVSGDKLAEFFFANPFRLMLRSGPKDRVSKHGAAACFETPRLRAAPQHEAGGGPSLPDPPPEFIIGPRFARAP